MLEPSYITGLVDGEGCFCISISKHKTNKNGFEVRPMFEIEMIIEDKPLLEQIRRFFDCGHIYELHYERYGWRPHVKYAVKSQKDIGEKIIPFFKKYSLKSKKRKDFVYFCKAFALIKSKNHLNYEGLASLREIQSKMNLRSKLKWSSAKVRENRAPGGERLITGNS